MEPGGARQRPRTVHPRSPRALIALIVLGTVVAACGGNAGHVQVSSKKLEFAPRSLSIVPDTPWFEATLSRDGRKLEVSIGDASCGQRTRLVHDVVEDADSVTVAFAKKPIPPATSPSSGLVVCPAIAVSQRVEVTLSMRLGDRKVYDGIASTPRTVSRSAELVDATWVPDGFLPDRPEPTTGHSNLGWQQTFHGKGADWYMFVAQEGAGSFRRLAPDPTPVTVHGIKGERYQWFNGTAQTIHWVEGGLDISVTGEMQGPPSFNHTDQLRHVAEGVRLPSGN